jgi:hypothetical protein
MDKPGGSSHPEIAHSVVHEQRAVPAKAAPLPRGRWVGQLARQSQPTVPLTPAQLHPTPGVAVQRIATVKTRSALPAIQTTSPS